MNDMVEQSPKLITSDEKPPEIVDHTPQILRRFCLVTSIAFVVLIFTLSVFGSIVVALLPSLKMTAPFIGLVVTAVLLTATFRLWDVSASTVSNQKGDQPTPPNHTSRLTIGKVSAITLSTLVMCAYLSELLIVEPVERIHFVKYGLLATLIFVSQATHSVQRRILAAVILSASIGALDESIQYFAPGRVFDLRDLVLNAIGAGFGAVFLWLALLWKQLLN